MTRNIANALIRSHFKLLLFSGCLSIIFSIILHFIFISNQLKNVFIKPLCGQHRKNTNSPPLNKKSAPFSLVIVAHDVFLQKKSACGEIGRRARLRIWCRETCRFESYQAHFSCGLPFRCTSKGIFCACSGKPRKTFGMNIPIVVHRRKTSCAFSPFRRPLARCSSLAFSTFGRKHKTPPDFWKIIGRFQSELALFHARVRTRTSVDFGKKPSPFTTLPYSLDRQARRGEGFCIFTAFTHTDTEFTFFTHLFRAIGDTRQLFIQKVKANQQSLHT